MKTKSIADFTILHQCQIGKIYDLLQYGQMVEDLYDRVAEILFREFNHTEYRVISLKIPIASDVETYTLVAEIIRVIEIIPLRQRNIAMLNKLFKYAGVIHHQMLFRGNNINKIFQSMEEENQTADGFISIVKAFDILSLYTFAFGGWGHLCNIVREFNGQKKNLKTGEVFLEIASIYKATHFPKR